MSIKLYKWLIIGVVWFFPSKANAQEIIIPDSVTPYKLQLIRAEKLIDSAKYKDALVILKKLVKEKPDYVDALNKMALAKIRLEKYKEAAIDLEKSELLLMDNYETKKLKGINFYLNNKFAESKAAIDTALSISREEKLDPDAELFYYQALLMYKGKSYKTALAACDAALDANYRYQAALALKGKSV